MFLSCGISSVAIFFESFRFLKKVGGWRRVTVSSYQIRYPVYMGYAVCRIKPKFLNLRTIQNATSRFSGKKREIFMLNPYLPFLLVVIDECNTKTEEANDRCKMMLVEAAIESFW